MTTAPPAPAPLSLRDLLRDVRGDFRRGFAAVLVFELLFKALAALLLLPALAALLFHLMRLSGRTAVTNADILAFLLSPAGVAYTVLLGLKALGLLLLEHAVVIGLVAIKQTGQWHGLGPALAAVALRGVAVLRLALAVLVFAALAVLPFAALAALAYSRLLTGHDVNYYLAERPPRFYVAAGLGLMLACGAALSLALLYTRWVFALPIVLLEARQPIPALLASAERSRGERLRLGAVLLGWLALSFGAQLLAVGAFKLLASGVLSGVGHRPGAVMPVVLGLLAAKASLVGGLAILTVLVHALLILRLYVHRSARLGAIDPAHWADALEEGPARPRRALFYLEAAALGVALVVGAGYLALTLPFELRDRTEGTAHRGASLAAPENTLAAVRAAIDAGVEWAEIDVQLTKDGEVILLHDYDFLRMTGDPRKPGELTLSQVRALRVKPTARFGGRFANERVPTLREVIDEARGRIKLNIELKFAPGQDRGPLARAVAGLLREEGIDGEDGCFVASLDYRGVVLCGRHNPNLRTAAIITEALGDVTRLDVPILSVHRRVATPDFIRAAHRANKEVHVWGVDTRRDMRRLIERGADNIITDHPELFCEVRRERQELGDAERLLLGCRYLLD